MKQIEKIVDINVLQQMQDDFAYAVGMAFITVDYTGKPITKPSGFTDFCTHLRKNPDYFAKCCQCDAHGGLQAAISGESQIYYCHAGLIDYAVPLILDGTYCGSVMGGQVKCSDTKGKEIKPILSETSNLSKDEELQNEWKKLKDGDIEKIAAVLRILQTSVLNLMRKGYMELMVNELKDKEKELLEEKNKRIKMEETMSNDQFKENIPREKADFLFSNLSIVSNLAYLEEAKQTEQSVYALSDMLRYSLERRDNQISTLGEELDYIKNYLTMEKLRLGDKFNYIIDVSEDYCEVPCPAMMLQPVVENAIEYTVENQSEGGSIEISGEQQNGDFVISVIDEGKGFPKEIIENINDEQMPAIKAKNRFALYNLNRNLCLLFGKKYHLEAKNLPNNSGAEVLIRIPMKNDLIK